MALRNLQKLQEDRSLLQERLSHLQRALAQLEGEKREAERCSLRLEKDKNALKKTLDKVSLRELGGGWRDGCPPPWQQQQQDLSPYQPLASLAWSEQGPRGATRQPGL